MGEELGCRLVGVVVEVVDPVRVEAGGAADDAVDLVALLEQELGQVGTVLAGQPGDRVPSWPLASPMRESDIVCSTPGLRGGSRVRGPLHCRDAEASGAFKPAIDPSSQLPLDPATVVEVKSKVGRIFPKRTPTSSRLPRGERLPDPTISGLIKMILRPGMTFVDAGANIGYFTLLASRIVGKTGRVFAIERDPANLSILLANIERNKATTSPSCRWQPGPKTECSWPAPTRKGP